MKNNKGITLVALVVIIVLLIIFSSAAIYTSVQSFKMIDLQKYKTQMQAIQNGLDEFYAEYENFYEKNKETFRMYGGSESEYMEMYLAYIKYTGNEENSSKTLQDYIEDMETLYEAYKNDSTNPNKTLQEYLNEFMTNNNYIKCNSNSNTSGWWTTVAASYGITTDEPQIYNQYYGISTTELEELLGVSDIDISEYFVINFLKRYVFSVTPINITLTEPDNDGNTNKNIYCLYELNEEEKIIEFKADNTGGRLDIEIIEKTLYYQIAKITLRGHESTIKKLYYDGDYDPVTGFPPTVESKKEFFEEVTGLGTEEVLIKIKKSNDSLTPVYKFKAEDGMEGLYSGGISVFLHEPPVLQNNMIPFKLDISKNNTGEITNIDAIICDINDPEWYNYTDNLDSSNLAAVILSNGDYNRNIGKTINGLFNGENANLYYNDEKIPEYNNTDGFVVKVWIPYNQKNSVIYTNPKKAYEEDFLSKTGIWLDVEWDFGNKKWNPIGHAHDWGNATCIDIGTAKGSSICKRCGIEERKTVAKLGHLWPEEWTVEQEVTCFVNGKESRRCQRNCEQEGWIEERVIEAPGKHDFDDNDWIVTQEATCKFAGSKYRECKRIGCREDGWSEVDEIPALDHDYNAWTVTQEATCLVAGSRFRECKRGCNEQDWKQVQEIAALGHDMYTEKEVSLSEGRGEIRCRRTGCTQIEYITTLELDNRNYSDYKSQWEPNMTDGDKYTKNTMGYKVPVYNTKSGTTCLKINLENVEKIEFKLEVYTDYCSITKFGISENSNNSNSFVKDGDLELSKQIEIGKRDVEIGEMGNYEGTLENSIYIPETLDTSKDYYIKLYIENIYISDNWADFLFGFSSAAGYEYINIIYKDEVSE